MQQPGNVSRAHRFVHVNGHAYAPRQTEYERYVVRSRAASHGWAAAYSKPRTDSTAIRRPSARLPEAKTTGTEPMLEKDETGVEWLDEDLRRLEVLCARVGVTVPQVLDAWKVDPFDTLPIPHTSFVNMILINYFKQWMILHPELDFPAQQSGFTARTWGLIKASPAGLTTSLLLCATALYFLGGQSLSTPTILQLKGRALRLIQEAVISGDSSDEILTAIISICNSATFTVADGGASEIQAHMAGLRDLVRTRDGLGAITPYIRRLLVFYDKSISFTAQIPRSFPQYIGDDTLQQVELPGVDPSIVLLGGFAPLIAKNIVYPSLVMALLRLQVIFVKIQTTIPSPHWKNIVTQEEWDAAEMNLDIVTVLSQVRRLSKFEFVNPYDIGEGIRLAALRLYYCLKQWCIPESAKPSSVGHGIDNSLINHVRRTIRQPKIDQMLSDDEARAFWWILCTIACCGCPLDEEILEPLEFLRAKLQLDEEEESISILSRFFFSTAIFWEHHTFIWARITEHRQHAAENMTEFYDEHPFEAAWRNYQNFGLRRSQDEELAGFE